MAKLTISDVATALGISKTTVSRAISGKGRIGEETRKKVMDYISVNEYTPNVIAKSLAQSKTYNIAVVLPADCNVAEMPFFQSVTFGICEASAERDYDVLAVYTLGNNLRGLERVLSNNKLDGVVLSRTTVDDEVISKVESHKVPFVAIGSTEDEKVVRVDHDHRSACKELTLRILEKGFEKVALIGGNNTHMVTRSRYQGFADAFREKGCRIKPELIYLNVESTDSIDRITEELLQQKAECIVCMDDMICSRVLQKLQREHISVPDVVGVASFYNSSLLDAYVPAVSTLEFDVKKLGMTAANVLIDLIEKKEVNALTLLPYNVSLKDSI